jgi:hypothetical protein
VRRRFIVFMALVCATRAHAAAVPTLAQHMYTGHMELTPASTPSTFTIDGMNPTGAGNLLTLSFTWCSGASSCGSATTNPPAVSSVKDSNNTTWTAGPQESNATDHLFSALYYCSNCAGGVASITVTFASATINDFQAAFGEYYNVASGTLDCSNASLGTGPTVTAGACTPTQAGDLYYQYCMPTSNGMGPSNAATAISGSGITWDATDLAIGGAAGRGINSGSGSLSLSFTLTGVTGNVNCVMAAFKASASSSGTAPTGMYIAHQQFMSAAGGATQADYFPTVGNLVVIESSDISDGFTAASDTTNGSYTLITNSGFPSFAYFPNAATGNPLHVSVTGSPSLLFFRLLDIVGANTSPIDSGRTCSAPSSTAGTGACKNSGTGVPPWTNAPNIAPSSSGLVIAVNGVGTGPNGIPTSPTGARLLCVTYTGETDGENFCRGDGYGVLNSSASAETWTWPNANGSTSSSWNAVAVSFKAPAAGTARPPTEMMMGCCEAAASEGKERRKKL